MAIKDCLHNPKAQENDNHLSAVDQGLPISAMSRQKKHAKISQDFKHPGIENKEYRGYEGSAQFLLVFTGWDGDGR